MHTKGKKWDIAYKDQGMGHGCYGITNDKAEVMVENISYDDAKHICKCVNNHERMKEALKTCWENSMRSDCWVTESEYNTIKNLINELDND